MSCKHDDVGTNLTSCTDCDNTGLGDCESTPVQYDLSNVPYCILVEEYKKREEYIQEEYCSDRGKEWLKFSEKMMIHIENYTIPQYGDKGDDTLSSYDTDNGRINACIASIKKYTARWGRSIRPHEAKLDLLKIAHYACMAHALTEE